jgi:chromosome segregation ATPase
MLGAQAANEEIKRLVKLRKRAAKARKLERDQLKARIAQLESSGRTCEPFIPQMEDRLAIRRQLEVANTKLEMANEIIAGLNEEIGNYEETKKDLNSMWSATRKAYSELLNKYEEIRNGLHELCNKSGGIHE